MAGFARGVCVDLKGYVLVSCGWDKHVVEVREPRMGFRLVQTLGREDGKEGSGAGEFNHPAGTSVDENNTLMVVEWKNHRVQFFD